MHVYRSWCCVKDDLQEMCATLLWIFVLRTKMTHVSYNWLILTWSRHCVFCKPIIQLPSLCMQGIYHVIEFQRFSFTMADQNANADGDAAMDNLDKTLYKEKTFVRI